MTLMNKVQGVFRARLPRVALAVSLVAMGTLGFAPYMFNNVSTQAAINAPLIRLTAATNGIVGGLPNDGAYFAKPTDIHLLDLSRQAGEIADLKVRTDLALAQIKLSERQLAELKAQEQKLKHRASVFTSATTARLSQDKLATQAALHGCEAERAQQLAALTRARKLAAQGFMSQAGVEKAEAAAALSTTGCEGTEAKLRSIELTRNAAEQGIFIGDSYNDAPYAVQQADRLLLQRQMIEKTLTDATAQYKQLKRQLGDMLARASYRAPAGTLVWSSSASSGVPISSGEPILDLVDCRRRFVQVALPERKAEAVRPGSPADIRLIGSDDWMEGKVVNITGAAGKREENLLAASSYSLPGDRQIMVNVALPTPNLGKLDASRKCEVGRLAEVRFSRTL